MSSSTKPGYRTPTLLLVEDDPGDQELVRRSLEDDSTPVDLRIAGSGEEALDYLYRRGAYCRPSRPLDPDLVLLDLNMPGMNGHDVLGRIRADSIFRRMPVVVFTTSQDERDIQLTYELGVNSYITKPGDLDRFEAVFDALKTYWFDVVVLPPGERVP